MRQSATLLVGEQHDDERDEIQEVALPAPQDERRHEQDRQPPFGRQADAGRGDRKYERRQEREESERRRAAIQVGPWWAPALAGSLAVVLTILLRVPLWWSPLTADEGGYAEVARLWAHSRSLYAGAWVDRPQGLILIFRAILDLGGGSALVIRVVAACVAAVAVLTTMRLTLRVAGRIPACAAALLMATAGASPWIESFTLAGELLAWVPVTLSLLAFVAYLRTGRGHWIVLAGLLTGCAVMIKQSAFDAGLAAVLYLLWSRGRGGLRPSLALIGSAVVPVAMFAVFAPSFHSWWYAVVTYRGQGDSIFTGSLDHRYHLFTLSLPALLKGLGVLAALAAVGWRRSPVLIRFWLGAAALGVLGGGNFHTHYYLQLVPPLSVLAGVGLVRVMEPRARAAALALAAAGVATLTVTAPIWFSSSTAQAKAIWPRDPHLVHDRILARYIRAHTAPHQRVLVLWAAADLYYLADRDPAVRYMWYRNIQSIPHALPLTQTVLERQWASLVVAVQPPQKIDKTGTVARILFENYRQIARVDGVPVYRPDQLDSQSEALRHEEHAILPSPPPKPAGRGDLMRL